MDLEVDPSELGTLDVDADVWVPYLDLYEAPMVPTRLKLGEREYVWNSSVPVKGRGALMPGKIHELRDAGHEPLVVERGGRYYIYVPAA